MTYPLTYGDLYADLSGTASSAPVYTIAVDWSGNGSFTDTGDDISARVLDRGTPLVLSYGRDQARAFAPMAPGRAQFELNNASRDYSPENAASPLYGRVLPGRPVRVSVLLPSTTSITLFRGQLDDFDINPSLESQSVQVTCLDALAGLRGATVSTPLYQGVRTGQAFGYLLDAFGWTGPRDLDAGASILPWWWLDNADGGAALQNLLDAEGPGAFAAVDSGSGAFMFRDRHHRLVRSASTTSQATWRSSGIEPQISRPMVYDHGWKDIVNSVDFSVPVRVPSGTASQVWSTTGRISIADGETVPVSASSSEPFVGAIVPQAGTDFTLVSGTVSVWLGRTSGASTTVFVKATGGPAVVADLSLRAYSVATQATLQVHAEDSTSIAAYGRRSWPTDRAPTWVSPYDAAAIAEILLADRAQRLPTVTVTFTGMVNARLQQQVVRDLSDRVHLTDALTGLDADFYIAQIAHTISGLNHTTSFGCEKVATLPASVMVLDVGSLDLNSLAPRGRDDPGTVFRLDSSSINTGILGT